MLANVQFKEKLSCFFAILCLLLRYASGQKLSFGFSGHFSKGTLFKLDGVVVFDNLRHRYRKLHQNQHRARECV